MKTADELFDGSNAHGLDDSAVHPYGYASFQAQIDDKRRLLGSDVEEWIGMYLVASERAASAENRLRAATDALRRIATWYDDESDFSDNTPTSHALETLEKLSA